MQRLLPPSPNWYTSKVCDVDESGQLCAFGSRNGIWLLELPARRFRGELIGHSNRVNGVALRRHYNTTICGSCSGDRSVRVWDTANCQQLHSHSAHKAEVLSVALCGENGDLVASGDKSGGLCVCSWRDASSRQTPDEVTKPAPGSSLNCLAAHPALPLLAAGFHSGLVLVLQLPSREVLARFTGHDLEIQSLAWRPSCASQPDALVLASAAKDRQIRLWDVQEKQLMKYVTTPKPDGSKSVWVTVAWMSGENSEEPACLLSSTSKGEMVQWDLTKPKGEMRRFTNGHTRFVFSASVAGRQMVTVSMDREIIVWDLSTLKVISTLTASCSAAV